MSIVLSFHSKEVTVELDELNMSNMLAKQEKILINKMCAEEILGGFPKQAPCTTLDSCV